MSRILTGVQSTGTPHLGNLLGAIIPAIHMANDPNNESFLFIADLHSLTQIKNGEELRQNTYSTAATWLAFGLDVNKTVFYRQSDIPEVTELSWYLSCFFPYQRLTLAHGFKDKADRLEDVNAGLFSYPMLMAADILLYQTDFVPVGGDQKQHVELARDIAVRFNQQYGNTFKVPEPIFGETGTRIMSLQDPSKKMSKSDENLNGFVSLLDDPKRIVKKFKRAITDSETEVRHDRDNKPGVSNLMEIYSCATGKSLKSIEDEFSGKGYGDFKGVVGEAVAETIRPVQDDYHRLLKDKGYLEQIMRNNAEAASKIAWRTLAKVRKKVGFVTV